MDFVDDGRNIYEVEPFYVAARKVLSSEAMKDILECESDRNARSGMLGVVSYQAEQGLITKGQKRMLVSLLGLSIDRAAIAAIGMWGEAYGVEFWQKIVEWDEADDIISLNAEFTCQFCGERFVEQRHRVAKGDEVCDKCLPQAFVEAFGKMVCR